MAANVKIDVFFTGVKQLQQEKSCLEQKLRDLGNERGELESSLHSVSTKNTQVRDIHSKMQETLKVAQIKVSQTRAQCEDSEKQNQGIRERLKDLNNRIEEQKNLKQEEIETFERDLASLVEKFTDARSYYTKASLQKEITHSKKDVQKLEKQMTYAFQEEETLSQQMTEMKLVEKTFPIPANTQGIVFKLFIEEMQAAEEARIALIEKQKALECCLKKIKDEWKEMEQKGVDVIQSSQELETQVPQNTAVMQ